MKYRERAGFIAGLAEEAFSSVISTIEMEAFDKAVFDDVTTIDYAIERYIIDGILEKYPGDSIISEEYNTDASMKKRTWIIDPVDGTCNFIHGIKMYGVQCAYCEDGEPVAAAIYLPENGETFTSWKGGGVYLNGERMHASQRPPEKAVISMGDFSHKYEELMELEKRIICNAAPQVERIRMLGAACADYAYVAAGRLEGNITFTQNSWDLMPGILMCREAGLRVTDVYGRDHGEDSMTIAVFSSEEIEDLCIGFLKEEASSQR